MSSSLALCIILYLPPHLSFTICLLEQYWMLEVTDGLQDLNLVLVLKQSVLV